MSIFPEYGDFDALALAKLVREGEISPGELLAEAKSRLEPVHARFNTVTHVADDLASGLIDKLDMESIFCGVPFLVKDLMLQIKDMPLSNGSNAMKSYIPNQNSAMADQLNASGLITFGKTTTAELGASSLTKTRAFGETLNPWDPGKNSGGSSGGSSVVVAGRVVPMAYSSDGGGSIRLPASYCGIFGFKPSRGINQFEDMSESWGGAVVSHVSTISVRDSAAYLDLVAGNVSDDYSVENPDKDSYLFSANGDERSLNIALITDAPTETAVHPECINAAETAARACEHLGHSVEPCKWNFDGRELMRAFLTIIMSCTYKDIGNIAVLLNTERKHLDLELNTRFLGIVGSGISQERVNQALDIWKKAALKLCELHSRYDVILTPTVATPPLQGTALDPNPLEKLLMKILVRSGLGKKAANDMFLEALIDKSVYQTPFTPIANITGQPAMSVPLYWDAAGLPHGAQFMADIGHDKTLFSLARQLETEYSWDKRIPKYLDLSADQAIEARAVQ